MDASLPTADLIIIIAVLVSALIGLARGLLKELLSLASWFAAFILALYFAPRVAEALGAIDDPSIRLVIGFVAVFAAMLIVGSIIQMLVGQLVKKTGLTGTDRFLGFLFGSARGVLVCVVGLIALRPFAQDSQWWQASLFTPELLRLEANVLQLVDEMRSVVDAVDNQ